MITTETFVFRHARIKINCSLSLLQKVKDEFSKFYQEVENYCRSHPEFQFALEPFAVEESAAQIIKKMAEAGFIAGVGPMAAVAGGIAHSSIENLIAQDCCQHLLIENGGDVVFYSNREVLIRIFCQHPHFRNIGLKFPAQNRITAVCSSSGNIGHSLSFGQAEIATVIAGDGFIADALATKVANLARPETKNLKESLAEIIDSGLAQTIILIYKDDLFISGSMPEFVFFKEDKDEKN